MLLKQRQKNNIRMSITALLFRPDVGKNLGIDVCEEE